MDTNARRNRTTSFSMPIHFCNDDCTEICWLFERSTLSLSGLTWINISQHRSAYIETEELPMLASKTKTVILGFTASPICTISLNSSDSCLCRPEVSTIITSNLSFLNLATPCAAMETGSVSVYEPKYATFAFVADCRVWSKAPARKVSAQTMADLNPRFW